MAAPTFDVQNSLTLPTSLVGEAPASSHLLTSDARMTLAVLVAMATGLSLFAGLALCDLLPFIGVMLRGF